MDDAYVQAMDAEPTTDREKKDRARALLHRWMVLYNPFYFMSALSLLGGILLISEGLEGSPVDWTLGHLALVGVVQGYELCLILTAAWLHRRGLIRPAVLLAFVECLFLLDPTSFTHVVAHFEPYDSGAAVLWAVLAPFKILGLCWALQLRMRPWAFSLASICLGLIAVVPTALDNGWAGPHDVLALVCWGLGFLLLLLRERPLAIASKATLDDWGRTVLTRARTALTWALPIGLGMHAWAWKSIFAVDLETYFLLPILLSVIWISKDSAALWPISAVVLVWSSPDYLMVTSLVLGAVCLYQARIRREGIYPFAAVLLFYLSISCWGWSGEGLPSPSWWADVPLIAATAWLAWRHWRKMFLMPAVWRFWVLVTRQDVDGFHLGIGLAVLSFVTLILGTWLGARMAGGPVLESDPPTESSGGSVGAGP